MPLRRVLSPVVSLCKSFGGQSPSAGHQGLLKSNRSQAGVVEADETVDAKCHPKFVRIPVNAFPLKWGLLAPFLLLGVESHCVIWETTSAPTSSRHSFGLQGDVDYI